MKYKFGVMSSVWTLEADNFDVARLAMSVFMEVPIIVAVYEPERAAFNTIDVLKEFLVKDYDKEAFKSAYKSIKECDLS